MSRRASTRWASCLLLVSCVACSSAPQNNTSRKDPTKVSSTAGTAAPTTGTTGTAGSFSSTDLGPTSNPDVLKTPTPPAPVAGTGGAPGAGAGGSNLTPEGCEVGKFCAPTQPDPDNCGTLDLKTDLKTVMKPGNVLVIFDRSTSMEADWGGLPRYQSAGNALTAAITPLKDFLTMGGIFFPSLPTDASMSMNPCPMGCNVADPIHWIPGPAACCLNIATSFGACDVNAIEQPDEINWGPADAFISGLPNQWHLNGVGQTPLGLAVQRAATAISAKTFTEPLVVIVMTDGEPNCETNLQSVIDQVTMWNAANIPTHVVGLPGSQPAADFLTQVATAGGTMTFIDPKDPAELENKLRTVITSTVRAGFEGCTFKLDPKAEVPSKLHLIIKQNGMDVDVPRDWSKDAHWKINAEGTQVDLEGQLCDMAMNGTLEGLRFVFGCVDVPPAPPPPPPPMLN